MSTRIMAQCYALQMPGVAKAVLISMADMANDEGFCWPSIERICERTCWKRRAVIDALAWLEGAGILRPNRDNGRKTTYWVEPDKFAPPQPVSGAADQCATRTGAADAPVQQVHGTSAFGAQNQCAKRTLTVKNRHRTNTPQPPADAGGAAGDDDGFAEVWESYPRKQAETQARRQWKGMDPRPDAETVAAMLSAIAAQKRSEAWQREGGRFVPKLSTWLHGQRWRDQVADSAPVSAVPAEWWTTHEGIRTKGAELHMPYSLAGLGNAYTDDALHAHARAYRAKVFQAAGPGPWRKAA